MLAGAAVVVLAVALTVALWPSAPQRTLPPTRARAYLAFDACLLTGPQGLADPAAAPVWAGLEDASTATHAKVSYLAAAGPATVGNALPYAAALRQRHCDVILAVGAPEVAAVRQEARANRGPRFVVVTDAQVTTVDNLDVVPAGAAGDVRSAVAALVRGLVDH